jgi:hypothetical protein
MTERSADRTLAEIANPQGPHGKLGRKLRVNRDRNWLLALTLNTFAKAADGVPPNDLDALILGAFEAQGLTADLLEHGRRYTAMPKTLRRELFPGSFGTLAAHADYGLDDLVRDLPDLDRAVRAMPNALDIDVVAVHDGSASAREFRRPGADVVRAHGGELLRAVEPDNPRRDLGTDPIRIKATTFHCTDETGTDWLGSDEVYWIFGSVGAGAAVTSRSHVFEDIDSGDNATFGGDEGWIWGHDQTPQPMPDGEIGSLVQLWEHDEGDPDKAKAAVAAAFAAAAGVLAVSGAAAWAAAVVAGVGAVVQWLLGFLGDDHIGDQTFVFTRQTLDSQVGKVGQSFDLTRRFTDGDGDYTATINVAHLAKPTPPPPPPPVVTVPDVVEVQARIAVGAITSAGLVPRLIGSSSVNAFVVSQSPDGGTSVARGSTVTLRTRVGPIP